MIRAHTHDGTAYVTVGPILNKSLEIGGGLLRHPIRSADIHFSFNTRGDHAGLRVYLARGDWMFELNLTDRRHWNWAADRFEEEGERPVFEGYPHE